MLVLATTFTLPVEPCRSREILSECDLDHSQTTSDEVGKRASGRKGRINGYECRPPIRRPRWRALAFVAHHIDRPSLDLRECFGRPTLGRRLARDRALGRRALR